MSQVKLVIDGESLITPDLLHAGNPLTFTPSVDRTGIAETQMALALQIVEQQFGAGGDAARASASLFREMHNLRASVEPDVWRRLVPVAQTHPVASLIHQDPFTGWSFAKPRGYSGDAQLLDFIYGHESVAPLVASATPLGRAIFDYTSRAPAASAVRERRDLLARHIDEIAGRQDGDTEILTIAAGHLREAALSSAFAEGRIARWVALDQDPLSIATIARDRAGTCVQPFTGSVRGILGKAYDLGRFDFVYAAGLYDYLPRPAAVKLTKRCLDMLKPGGTFLFANFHSDIVDGGYMETFMNWSLLLRDEAEMWDIVNASVDRNAVEASVVFGENRNIVYAVIRKRD